MQKKLRMKTVNEELLAETARKHTVLYDKSRADFKDRRKKLLAWNDVARTVGYRMQWKLFDIMKILIKSLLQKSGLFVCFFHLKQTILAIFAHSGELNPSLNNSSDKDAALFLLPSLYLSHFSTDHIGLFSSFPGKNSWFTNTRLKLTTFDKMNIYFWYNFKINRSCSSMHDLKIRLHFTLSLRK